LETSYFTENFGTWFFEKTAGSPGLSVQSLYATDGALPIIAGKDVGKFALVAFKNPKKYIGKFLICSPSHIYDEF
jgi:hypothetical protein